MKYLGPALDGAIGSRQPPGAPLRNGSGVIPGCGLSWR